MNLFQKLFQKYLKQFFLTQGRAPGTPKEWSDIQDLVVREINETKGVPKKNIPPFQGWKPEIVPKVEKKITIDDLVEGPVRSSGPKGDRIWDFSKKKGDVVPFPDEGIRSLIKKGDVQLGKAPKTTKETLKLKKDRGILLRDADEARAEIRRKNKQAVEDFKKKFHPKEPDKFQFGGIAPLVGEPSYSADFYDDRTPMKKGKKAKKKKKKGKKIPDELKKLMRMRYRQLPHGRQRYRSIKDLPEGILELLQKDPGFDREAFEKAYWAGEDFRWTDPGWSEGMRGQYSPMTGAIELNLSPFGEEAYPHWKLRSPHQDPSALKDVDKAKIALHELRHKNILEDPNLFKTQPEWVQRSEGSGYLPKGGVTGHELYNRFLDKRYYPPEEDPGPNDPYFDKILKDYWEPYAKDYESTAKRRLSERHGEGIETLAAQGGRIGLAGGGALFKFIERLFIKASNDIRLGRGKWKGLDQKQIAVQHDNLTKKLTEWEKTGNTEGLEVYFDVNPHEAFAAASKKVKKSPGFIKQGDPITSENFGASQFAPSDESLKARELAKTLPSADERTALKTKYPGITDDLVEKILIDDNPQRKADVLSTVDQYMKLQEVGKSEKEAYDIMVKSIKDTTKHAEGGRIGFNPGGPVDHDALVQMYLEEGLSYEEAVQAAQAASGLDMDISKKAEGGRADFIFGGSAGLRALLKRLKGPYKRVFPPTSSGLKKFMSQSDTEYIDSLKLQQLEAILKAAKIDKETLAHSFKVKKMNDPGLDFLMGKLDEAGLKAKNIDKYTNVDKDIMDIEMMIKNYTEKKLKRRPNYLGGRIGYAGGGQAGLPAVTLGLPQGPAMQQPQMPVGPQPTGIPGGTIVAQNQMQQSPWMGQQMQQGMGGMPRPQPGGMPQRGMPQRGMPQRGMPRPMAAGGGRIGFGLGGFNKARRAFLKMLAGLTGAGVAAGTGLLKLGKAAKVVPKVTETITRGADGMPTYITDLIEVVKAKGTANVIEGVKRSDYSTVHSYKGVDVIEDGAGNIKIKSDKTGVATDPYTGKTHEGISQENHIQITKGEWIEPTKTKKGIKTKDEYTEGTVYPDRDGKMKDFEEGLDEAIHKDFKSIADELHEEGFYYPLDAAKKLKASGGLARMLGE